MPTYFNSEIKVLVGDYVEFKQWLFFWKGWQNGRIWYVPDISPLNTGLEHNSLTWVAIHNDKGEQVGVLVDPETNQLQKTVRFIRLSDDDLTKTPSDYYFGDEEIYSKLEDKRKTVSNR